MKRFLTALWLLCLSVIFSPAAMSAELTSVNVNGTVSARPGETLSVNVYGYRYENPGSVVNFLQEGRCLLSGRINGEDVYIFTTDVRDVMVDTRKGLSWVTVDYVFRNIPYTLHLEVTSGSWHGNGVRYWIFSYGQVVSSSATTRDALFLPVNGSVSTISRSF